MAEHKVVGPISTSFPYFAPLQGHSWFPMWCFLYAVEFLSFSWKRLWDSLQVKAALRVGGKCALYLKVSAELLRKENDAWVIAGCEEWLNTALTRWKEAQITSLPFFSQALATQRRWLRPIWTCTTSSSWHGPFSTWATASPPSSPGPPVGTSGIQVWPPGGSLCWSCWGIWDWWCVMSLAMSPGSVETGGYFCTWSVHSVSSELWTWAEHWHRDQHWEKNGDSLSLLCQTQRLSPLGTEQGYEEEALNWDSGLHAAVPALPLSVRFSSVKWRC